MAIHQDPSRWDIGNPLLAPGPIQLWLNLGTAPDGATFLIATVRTTSGTLTGEIPRELAVRWREDLDEMIARMPAIAIARDLPPDAAQQFTAARKRFLQNGPRR